jgi:hypothetical protein
MTNAAGWYPDGTGRHAQRYFDGATWTDHVADAAGHQALDPMVAAPVAAAAAPGPAHAASSSSVWQSAPAATSFAPPSMPSTTAAPRAAAGSSSGGFVLTAGVVVAGVGALLALISIFVLDYWKAGGVGISLGDIADAPDGAGINGLVAAYAGFGRFLALLVIAAAVVAVLQLPALATINERLPMIAAGVAGVFALWHLIGLFVAPEGAGTAVTGLLGVVGLAGLAAAPFLTKPLGAITR